MARGRGKGGRRKGEEEVAGEGGGGGRRAGKRERRTGQSRRAPNPQPLFSMGSRKEF